MTGSLCYWTYSGGLISHLVSEEQFEFPFRNLDDLKSSTSEYGLIAVRGDIITMTELMGGITKLIVKPLKDHNKEAPSLMMEKNLMITADIKRVQKIQGLIQNKFVPIPDYSTYTYYSSWALHKDSQYLPLINYLILDALEHGRINYEHKYGVDNENLNSDEHEAVNKIKKEIDRTSIYKLGMIFVILITGIIASVITYWFENIIYWITLKERNIQY